MATERDREEREREEQQQAAVQAEEQAEEPGREAIATELLNKAHDELNKAAIEKQLTLKGASAREHIATALNIVERRPDKGMEAWPKRAIQHALQAQTILNEGPGFRPSGVISEHVLEARTLCDSASKWLEQSTVNENCKEAARDSAAVFRVFGHTRPEDRTAIPLDKPLDIQRENDAGREADESREQPKKSAAVQRDRDQEMER